MSRDRNKLPTNLNSYGNLRPSQKLIPDHFISKNIEEFPCKCAIAQNEGGKTMLYQNADRLFLHLEALDVVPHATHSYQRLP